MHLSPGVLPPVPGPAGRGEPYPSLSPCGLPSSAPRVWDLQGVVRQRSFRGGSGRAPAPAGAVGSWLVQELSSCSFMRPGRVSLGEMPRTVLFARCTCFRPGGGRACVTPVPGCGSRWPGRLGCWVSTLAWPRARTREATTRKGWSWGKAVRTGSVKGKEGFGSLSGPFQSSHAGVWAEPRAAWGLSQSEPGLAPAGGSVGIQTLLAGVLAEGGCGLPIPVGLALAWLARTQGRAPWLSSRLRP